MDVPEAQTRRADPKALEPYKSWARFLFGVLAILAAIGVLLVVFGTGIDPERVAASLPLVVLLTVNVVATLVVFLALIRGLTTSAAWAVHAVSPVCLILIVFGLLRTLTALTRNEVLIPLETMAALLVLSRPHGADLLPDASASDRRRVTLITAVVAVTYFVPLVTPLIAG
jgi:hypothetical protein